MASWTDIPNSSLETGAPARSVDALAFRDNPIAIAEGAVGAPRIQAAALISTEQMTTTNVGNNLTTGYVGARTAGLAVYAIGSYIFALEATNTTRLPGSTVAGSALRVVSLSTNGVTTGGVAAFIASTTGLPGSWRCMGYSRYDSTYRNGTTLWLRYA